MSRTAVLVPQFAVKTFPWAEHSDDDDDDDDTGTTQTRYLIIWVQFVF